MSVTTGIGSWPGEDMRTALRWVRDLLAEPDSDGTRFGLPYLPELPARGPGADMIGRAAGLLVEMPVDLQPSGWRLVDHPGRDLERARQFMRSDLDDLAEAFDGYAGPFKVSVTGPWTLAAHLRVARGERVVVDEGARRDVAQSLAEGIRDHLGRIARVLPGSDLTLQLDEPSLPAVLAGALPTSSGFGRLRAVDPEEVRRMLAEVVEAARPAGAARVVVHCCAPQPPLPLLRGTGIDGVALDTSLLTRPGWEQLGESIDAGVALWAGLDVAEAAAQRAAGREGAHHRVVDPLLRRWRELGLDASLLDTTTLTPPCGLAGVTPQTAVDVHRVLLDSARELHWRIAES